MVTPCPSWRHLLTWRRALLVAALFALAGLMIGCFGTITKPPAPPAVDPATVTPPAPPAVEALPVPTNETPEAKQVRQLRAQLAHHEGLASSLRTQLDQAEQVKRQAEQEARLAPIRATITWVTWIGFLAGMAGVVLRVALFFWRLPIGGGTAWALVFGGPAVALCAQGFGLALPWLAIAGLAVLILAALTLAVLALLRWGKGQRVLSYWYQATADELGRLDASARERLDQLAIEDQKQRGVLAINDRALFGHTAKAKP